MKTLFKILGVIVALFIALVIFITYVNVKDSKEQEAEEKKIEQKEAEKRKQEEAKKTYNEKSQLYEDVMKVLREDRMNAINVYSGHEDIAPKDRQTISTRIFDQYEKDEKELKHSKELRTLIDKDKKDEMTTNERTEFIRSFSEEYYRIAVEGKEEFKKQ